jgi:hypothetical protein
VGDGEGDRVPDRLGAVPGERRAVLGSGATVLRHARQCSSIVKRVVKFDESADGGAIEAEDEVSFPMTGYGPDVRFGGSFADENLVGDEALGACMGARPRNAERTTGAQASGELTTQGAPTLDEQCLVDRLM